MINSAASNVLLIPNRFAGKRFIFTLLHKQLPFPPFEHCLPRHSHTTECRSAVDRLFITHTRGRESSIFPQLCDSNKKRASGCRPSQQGSTCSLGKKPSHLYSVSRNCALFIICRSGFLCRQQATGKVFRGRYIDEYLPRVISCQRCVTGFVLTRDPVGRTISPASTVWFSGTLRLFFIHQKITFSLTGFWISNVSNSHDEKMRNLAFWISFVDIP